MSDGDRAVGRRSRLSLAENASYHTAWVSSSLSILYQAIDRRRAHSGRSPLSPGASVHNNAGDGLMAPIRNLALNFGRFNRSKEAHEETESGSVFFG